jgi:hypothetical protein
MVDEKESTKIYEYVPGIREEGSTCPIKYIEWPFIWELCE